MAPRKELVQGQDQFVEEYSTEFLTGKVELGEAEFLGSVQKGEDICDYYRLQDGDDIRFVFNVRG